MHWADIIAEQRASEAARKGELSGLDGEGVPLDLSEDPLVPPELRAIHRVLKNAGYSPPEITAMKAIADLEKNWPACPTTNASPKQKCC
ncbi:MAG: DnaJ family domain-containing protein [Burkholderiales bacterium]